MSNVVLLINGQRYIGWTEVSVSRSLINLAGEFDLSLTRSWSDAAPVPIRPGMSCKVMIGDEVVISGYIDDFVPSYDDKTIRYQVTGRDKTGDLVDCAAVYKGSQWNNVNLTRIATDLCEPFGIRVIDNATQQSFFPYTVKAAEEKRIIFAAWRIEQGETVEENLRRAARQNSALITSTPEGDLLITAPSTKVLPETLKLGVNIKAAAGRFSWRNRHDRYLVKGAGYTGGDLDSTNSSDNVGRAMLIRDPAVNRHRPKIVLSEDAFTAEGATQRGQWQKTRDIGTSTQTQITVTDWYYDDSHLWPINVLVNIKDEYQGLDVQWLIVAVNFIEGDSGRLTQLTLMPSEALSVEPPASTMLW
ncbi:phage tail protein [Vibrio parahaemolyticus]|nr:phage tail protein [Vibrio parahaemolyticus]MCR9657263.1 phage tail protein [Vibrio parahaemolyticus]